jgi:hypothetical protein
MVLWSEIKLLAVAVLLGCRKRSLNSGKVFPGIFLGGVVAAAVTDMGELASPAVGRVLPFFFLAMMIKVVCDMLSHLSVTFFSD